MLARVLLTLHNLHHYQAFFVALQSAIRLRLIMIYVHHIDKTHETPWKGEICVGIRKYVQYVDC